MRKITILLFSFFIVFAAQAQDDKLSWRKHIKLAKTYLSEGRYGAAAEHYEAAYKKKNRKEYIFKAGEYYAVVKDYKKAAECYSNVKDDNADFALVGLRYARALKQSGQHELANKEFVYFLSSYTGSDRDAVTRIVQNEIKGCEMMRQLNEDVRKNAMRLTRMSDKVNTPEPDFAPVPYSDDILYFTSTVSSKATIYRTQKQSGNWTKATVPAGFPKVDVNFANGTFSPDGKRFYFTECEAAEEGLQTRCEIYVIVRKTSAWSEPQRLKDYINMSGASTTHPYVTNLGDKELLYFSSNRQGGYGGMDIWAAARSLTDDGIDFDLPYNLGANINSAGDEITPFMDVSINTIYFSSNGQPSVGGLDIFKSKGNEKYWAKAENVGLPVNSAADDYYYVVNKSKTGGFLVSNRMLGKEKITTTDEDIFEFSYPPKTLAINGAVFDKQNKPLTNARLTLYEIVANGQKRVLTSKLFADGNFGFVLLPEKNLRLEVEKEGFKNDNFEFNTNKKDSLQSLEKNFYLETDVNKKTSSSTTYVEDAEMKASTPVVLTNKGKPTTTTSKPVVNTTTKPVDNSKVTSSVTTTKVETKPVVVSEMKPIISNTYGTERSMVGRDGTDELRTTAPITKGVTYKIQLLAGSNIDFSHPRYRTVKDMGRLDTELIVPRGINRVLLSEFFQYEDAKTLLPKVRNTAKEFAGAYIVKYEDGIRVGLATK
jgi:hypothetical protein